MVGGESEGVRGKPTDVSDGPVRPWFGRQLSGGLPDHPLLFDEDDSCLVSQSCWFCNELSDVCTEVHCRR